MIHVTRRRAYFITGLCAGLAMGCASNPCTSIPTVPRLVQLAPSEGSGFPYTFIDDYKAPRYTYFRAEGRGSNVVLDSAPCGVDYVEKYMKKKLGAPSAEISYFAAQAKIAESLRAAAGVAERVASAESVKVGFVGDIMWIRNNWDNFLGDDVRQAMDTADFWLGNLETVVSKSTPVQSAFPDYATYNSKPGVVRSFQRPSGGSYFKALSVANNHILDFRDLGARETLEFLDQEHILHNGLTDKVGACSYTAFEAKGIKFGFYAATWGVNESALLKASKLHLNVIAGFAPERSAADVDMQDIERALAEMKADGVDIKIVSLHWGHEFERYPDPLEVLVARRIVKAGADIIMGTHPHVEQPLEVCFVNGQPSAPCNIVSESEKPRKALIMYSLGDFVTAKYTRACQQGPMQEIAVTKDASGAVNWDFAAAFQALNYLDYGKKLNHHLSIVH